MLAGLFMQFFDLWFRFTDPEGKELRNKRNKGKKAAAQVVGQPGLPNPASSCSQPVNKQ
jgi:hypothetical protein